MIMKNHASSAPACCESRQFQRMATAIEWLHDHYREAPDLETVAARAHMSPAHFQRQFIAWAGISPKQMLRHIQAENAKAVLHENRNLLDTALDIGLSGNGRLHDLFVQIEGMSPAEYRQQGAGLHIDYAFGRTPFGDALAASTAKGICHLAFVDDATQALHTMQQEFPQAQWHCRPSPRLQHLWQVLAGMGSGPGMPPVHLHLRGTPFQIKVWQALLRIAPGQLQSYGDVAHAIGRSGASRAVGTAIGSNPVAWLIPCHRVIRATGMVGEYRWQRARKLAMLGCELASCRAVP